MIYQILVICAISAIAGIKKPIYGGLSASIFSPIVHLLFYEFDFAIFFILIPLGFVVGITIGGVINRFYCGIMDDKDIKPYYTSMHIQGGSTGSGIVYTDEEDRNARQNEGKEG